MTFELLIALIGGSSAAALITSAANIILAVYQKKSNKKTDTAKDIEDIKDALKILLLDRMREKARGMLEEELVDLDDKRVFNQMYDKYHNNLNGNGDADEILKAVNELPVIIEGVRHGH